MNVGPDDRATSAYGYDRDKDPARFLKSVTEARDRLSADAKRLYLFGFSRGAILAVALGLNHPGMFRGVVAVAGAVPETLVDRETLAEERRSPPFYAAHGDKDPQKSLAIECAEWLKTVATPVETVEFAGSHALPELAPFLGKALGWIDASSGK